MRAKAAVIALAAALGAAALGAAGCGGDDDGAAEETVEARAPVSAMEVEPRDLSRSLSVTARVEARATIDLASRAGGVVTALRADVGDRVSEGEIVAELDRAEESAELERARAEAAAAAREYERVERLRERGVVSEADYLAAERERDVTASAERLWATRVGFGRVRAPRGGVIRAREVEVGEAVDARETLLELLTMDDLVIRAPVSERDVVFVEEGERARVSFDAAEDGPREAVVRRVAPAAAPDSQLVTVELALPEDAAASGVRPGFLARVELPVEELEGALAVPSEAIGDDEGERYVYAIENEHLVRREVELGAARDPLTEVRAGLEAGDIVLASNPIDMREGERVRIVGWRSP